MKRSKAIVWVPVVIAAVGALVFVCMRNESPGAGASEAARVSAATAAPGSAPSISQPAPATTHQAAVSQAKRSPAEWQRMLGTSQGIVAAFASAVEAAEAGDFGALRELHWLVTECAPLFGYVRRGGTREQFLQQQSLYLPPGGRELLESNYDRCAAIALAPEFAKWSENHGPLDHEYWELEGEKLGDPMFTSFEVANFVDELSRAKGEDRELLKSSIGEDVRKVLRSGDGTAWYDLGMRALSDQVGADPSYGLALILAACERGYDCSSVNRHNLALNCGMNTNCSANSLEEAFNQQYPADVNARARTHLLELQLLLQQGDWARIERFLPLDGAAFRPAAASSRESSS